MSYDARVYNILIASPSDVSNERNAAAQIIDEWNHNNSKTKKIILMPIRWETDTSPAMGNHPQEIINKQILEDSDLLIGIFWTKVGTPTESFIGGAVEEIEKHVNTNKPAMLYFSQKAIPKNHDPEQLSKVKQLEKEYQRKGLLYPYKSTQDFKNKFKNDLIKKMNDKNLFPEYEIRTSSPQASKVNFYKKTDNQINEKIESVVALSDEAKKLLINASQDKDGEIFKLDNNSSFIINTNTTTLANSENTNREIANWREAFDDLEKAGYIKYHSINTYKITSKGFERSDIEIKKKDDPKFKIINELSKEAKEILLTALDGEDKIQKLYDKTFNSWKLSTNKAILLDAREINIANIYIKALNKLVKDNLIENPSGDGINYNLTHLGVNICYRMIEDSNIKNEFSYIFDFPPPTT